MLVGVDAGVLVGRGVANDLGASGDRIVWKSTLVNSIFGGVCPFTTGILGAESDSAVWKSAPVNKIFGAACPFTAGMVGENGDGIRTNVASAPVNSIFSCVWLLVDGALIRTFQTKMPIKRMIVILSNLCQPFIVHSLAHDDCQNNKSIFKLN